MTSTSVTSEGMAAHYDEAALWRVRIEADAMLAQSDAFHQWLEDSDRLEAYSRACLAWTAVEDHMAASELIPVRHGALAYLRRARFVRLLSRQRLGMIAATLALVALAGAGGWQYWQLPTEYRTTVGERRFITLSDGSRIFLDSATALKVRYTKNSRQLVLETGRAHFDVAHDITRPFTVTAGRETIVAVGTEFDVERLGEKVLVTLIEGHVVIKSAADDGHVALQMPAKAAKPTALAAGEELIASTNVARPIVKPVNLPVASEWETGSLILSDEPLAEAVERVNRYTDHPLIVDPSVAQLRVSGVFKAGDITTFLDAITSLLPVQASVNDADQTVLQRRS